MSDHSPGRFHICSLPQSFERWLPGASSNQMSFMHPNKSSKMYYPCIKMCTSICVIHEHAQCMHCIVYNYIHSLLSNKLYCKSANTLVIKMHVYRKCLLPQVSLSEPLHTQSICEAWRAPYCRCFESQHNSASVISWRRILDMTKVYVRHCFQAS